MHPVDHVVPDVHRVSAVRQYVDLECVAETRRLEGLIPPARALEQRFTNVLGRAGIDPVLNWLHWFTDCRFRVFLLETMAPDVAHHHRLADRHPLIVEADA